MTTLFHTPPASAIEPYPYQREALEALDIHIQTREDNPCVVIPTGGGKSLLMAWAIQNWKRDYPPFRVCVLAHRKELVRQNYEELVGLWPGGDIGIYAAGLGRKDEEHAVIFAGIDSIFKHWGDFRAFDVIIVDECFPAGTLVDGIPIENVRIGDVITTYNETTETFEKGKVTDVFSRYARATVRIVANGQVIESTSNHPFFTNEGWKKACEVTESMLLLRHENTKTDMQTVWNRIHTDSAAGKTAQKKADSSVVLQPTLPECVHVGISEDEQPDVRCPSSGVCVEDNEGIASLPYGKRGKRKTTSARTDFVGVVTQLENGICCSNKTIKRNGIPDVLQAGCSKPGHKSWSGDRREFAQTYIKKESGLEEGQSARWVRVESVSVQESGCDRGPAENSQDGHVYNLTVTPNNTYTANGFVVHNCHRIPASGEGKYREFIKGCKLINPKLRVMGFTATPYRMGCGPICHKDHILQKVCYEANVGDLIAGGYLCRLRSKVGDVQPDLSNVKRNSGGDYIEKSLAAAVDQSDVVSKAVNSAMGHIAREARKSCIWFCVDIDHCHRVSAELRKYGVDAPVVSAKTPPSERDRIAKAFVAGRYQHLANMNVYTEGFNAKRVDCVVLLRPTLSKGLFAQMVGRGLRRHPDKDNCLVLDYAHCIDEHGPIDCMDAGDVKLAECQGCGDTFSRAIRVCPHCGWEIPKQELERVEAEEREKKMHEDEASKRAILGGEPETAAVDEVSVHRHRKPGSPDSIRVVYRCGVSQFSEWVCPDHPGFAGQKARQWWMARFGRPEAEALTVDWALEDMLLGARIKDVTAAVTVVRRGKYCEIVRHQLKAMK